MIPFLTSNLFLWIMYIGCLKQCSPATRVHGRFGDNFLLFPYPLLSFSPPLAPPLPPLFLPPHLPPALPLPPPAPPFLSPL